MARLPQKRPVRDKAPTPLPQSPRKLPRGRGRAKMSDIKLTDPKTMPKLPKRKRTGTETVTVVGRGGKERREKVTRTSPKPAPTRPKKPGKPVNRPLPKLFGTAIKRMAKAVSTRSNIRKARRRVKKT